jgi:hypothetical protein
MLQHLGDLMLGPRKELVRLMAMACPPGPRHGAGSLAERAGIVEGDVEAPELSTASATSALA